MKEQEFDRRVLINRTRPEKCDKLIQLFQLMHPNENKMYKPYDKEMSNIRQGDCSRPFIVFPINATNMILVAAYTVCPNPGFPFVNKPVEIIYNKTLPCFKVERSPPFRRGLKECFNTHTNESQIELCGKANKFFMSFYMLSISMTLVIIRNICLSSI
jgi:voltage-dependent calcium channel alpha-2/delta-3